MSPCVRRVRKICKIICFNEFSRKLSRSPPRRDLIISKNLPGRANFLKCCRGGVWGGEAPLRNLRYPCLAPVPCPQFVFVRKNFRPKIFQPKSLLPSVIWGNHPKHLTVCLGQIASLPMQRWTGWWWVQQLYPLHVRRTSDGHAGDTAAELTINQFISALANLQSGLSILSNA